MSQTVSPPHKLVILQIKDMNLITPTEREARLSTKDNESGVVEISKKLNKMTNSENIILKLGKEGLIIFSYQNKIPLTKLLQ